jgi:hypothetical protein
MIRLQITVLRNPFISTLFLPWFFAPRHLGISLIGNQMVANKPFKHQKIFTLKTQLQVNQHIEKGLFP